MKGNRSSPTRALCSLRRDGLLDQLAMLLHAIQGDLHGLQHRLRQLRVVTMFGHALDQRMLLAHHLLGAGDMPVRLDEMVVLRGHCSNSIARGALGYDPFPAMASSKSVKTVSGVNGLAM